LVGDEILVQVSGILLNLSRVEDTVSRMGGDEIALLLPGCSLEVAIERAEQIRSVIAGHAFSAGASEPLGLSVSVGVAHAPTHALELRTLYSAADQALYAAKRAGRDQVVARELPAQLPDQLGDVEREARAG
jgi:diguanylate cyclase (GGDEF)-like protein